jgi:uncharacterized protein (TIGR02284 family)
MATAVWSDLKSALCQLIEVDYDAVEAYRAATDRLRDAAAKATLTAFMADHGRHISEVGAELSAMGGEPPRGPDIRRVLAQGKVVIAGLFGDQAVLRAMKANEDDTNTAYERAAARSDLTPTLESLLRRNLDDERRHRVWIANRLKSRPEETSRGVPPRGMPPSAW